MCASLSIVKLTIHPTFDRWQKLRLPRGVLFPRSLGCSVSRRRDFTSFLTKHKPIAEKKAIEQKEKKKRFLFTF